MTQTCEVYNCIGFIPVHVQQEVKRLDVQKKQKKKEEKKKNLWSSSSDYAVTGEKYLDVCFLRNKMAFWGENYAQMFHSKEGVPLA